MIKIPQKKSILEIKKFFIKKGLVNLVKATSKDNSKPRNDIRTNKLIAPDLRDLYMLFQYVSLNKRTTILEFGSGWSSLIFYFALRELKFKYFETVKKLRRNNPFELFLIENQKKYLNISRKRIKSYQNKEFSHDIKIHYGYSDVKMTEFEKRICTEYKSLPTCNPDFIYLDGPDQFKVKNKINGITTAHRDMMPMSCDLLKIEYFLTPGTIIVVDGRGANSSFLKDSFKRKWIYKKDDVNDQHIFYLDEKPLGVYNKRQLEFYKKN